MQASQWNRPKCDAPAATAPSLSASNSAFTAPSHVTSNQPTYFRVPVRKSGVKFVTVELSIGDESTLKDAWLQQRQVKLIIHCALAPTSPLFSSHHATYRRIELRNDGEIAFSLILSELTKMVNEAMVEGKNVLVCCPSGKSHCVAITLMYLMMVDRKSLRQAVATLKACGAELNLTQELKSMLASFEPLFLGTSSLPDFADTTNEAPATAMVISETPPTEAAHDKPKNPSAMEVDTPSVSTEDDAPSGDTDSVETDEDSDVSSHSSSNTAALSKSSSSRSKPETSSKRKPRKASDPDVSPREKMTRMAAKEKNRLVDGGEAHETAQEPAKKKQKRFVDVGAAAAAASGREQSTFTVKIVHSPKSHSKATTPSGSPTPTNGHKETPKTPLVKNDAQPVLPPSQAPTPSRPHAQLPPGPVPPPGAPPAFPYSEYMLYPQFASAYSAPYSMFPTMWHPSMFSQYAFQYPRPTDHPQPAPRPADKPLVNEMARPAEHAPVRPPPIHNTRSTSPALVDSAAQSLLSLLHAPEPAASGTTPPAVEKPAAPAPPPAPPAPPRNKVPSLLSPAQLTRSRVNSQKPSSYNPKKWGPVNWAHRTKPVRPIPAGNLTPVQRNSLADDLRVPTELLHREVASELPQLPARPEAWGPERSVWLVVKTEEPPST